LTDVRGAASGEDPAVHVLVVVNDQPYAGEQPHMGEQGADLDVAVEPQAPPATPDREALAR
jgi:hypothetical protein